MISVTGGRVPRGDRQASSGQQDVGHKGVATRGGVFSLCSHCSLPAGSRLSRFSRGVAAFHFNHSPV
ncbi:hypothetical protein E2636_13715 [Paenisporosarcina antarctica]|uniref:Uncharacterized protein n=1 Tax=Paenisporosarcina antarctica TaxID=417367 RepID=A0A4P7A142_9BACL|nr:hypothetical protein E2636_13715 [Paenisporosarcina antarctica]